MHHQQQGAPLVIIVLLVFFNVGATRHTLKPSPVAPLSPTVASLSHLSIDVAPLEVRPAYPATAVILEHQGSQRARSRNLEEKTKAKALKAKVETRMWFRDLSILLLFFSAVCRL